LGQPAKIRQEKAPLFEKSGAKTFVTLEPVVLNAPGIDSKKVVLVIFRKTKELLSYSARLAMITPHRSSFAAARQRRIADERHGRAGA
jgi:hypothetical protein